MFVLPLMSQMVDSPPAMQKMWVRSLGQEDPLEKGVATHSSILAWRVPWTEEPVHGVVESDMTEQVTFSLSFFLPPLCRGVLHLLFEVI